MRRNDTRHIFRSYVRDNMGSVHFMKAIITVGVPKQNTSEALKSLLQTVETYIIGTKQKHRMESAVRAAEEAKNKAYELREKFKRGQRLHNSLHRDEDALDFQKLDDEQKHLYAAFLSRALHVEHDKAQAAYGHGIARSNEILKEGDSFGNLPHWKPPTVVGSIAPDVATWALLGM